MAQARRASPDDARARSLLHTCERVQLAIKTFEHERREEALAMLDAALETCDHPALLFLAFQFHFRLGDLASAERYVRRRLAVAPEHSADAARAWNNLGLIAFFRDDLEAAEAHMHRSLAIDTALGDQQGIARDLGNLAMIPEKQGDLAQARRMYLESLAIAERVDAKPIIATKLSNLADIALAQRDRDQARKLWMRALAIFEELKDTTHAAHCARCLAGLDNMPSVEPHDQPNT
jgi:tetratricopeptide (TPR) repeat protein